MVKKALFTLMTRKQHNENIYLKAENVSFSEQKLLYRKKRRNYYNILGMYCEQGQANCEYSPPGNNEEQYKRPILCRRRASGMSASAEQYTHPTLPQLHWWDRSGTAL